GEPVTFRSALVPPYIRKTRSLEAAVPWLYLKGVSSGEMGEALKVLVGPEAEGLSASTVLRLKQVWGQEYRDWCESRLDKDRWVYVWADGVYSGLRAEQAKLCALVVIGVNERGQKRFLAIEGVRESTQSWREVLLKLKARGMNVPELAIGDGAMGFWAALEEVYPETRQQRCWMHKTMNVLNCLPKSAQPKAKQALHEIWQAETRADAEKAFDLFLKTYEPKYPKAAVCLHKDREELMAFYDFPAQHWGRLDGGDDAIENIEVVLAHNEAHGDLPVVDFLIKWNPRRQDKVDWLAIAEQKGKWIYPREGKRVALFSVQTTRHWKGHNYSVRRVIRIIERTIDKQGQQLLV
ncbi:IS256 family transposase, partial [Thiolapillus sp.]|uniref:IS256 family transposase n=1 Tax=Thiolapillus sp. TaxID=2017437 RepID=UPI003AF8EEE3